MSLSTAAARANRGAHTEGRTPEELRELVSHWGAELELAPAEVIIEWAAATFGDRFCITSSMGDAVLAHLAAKVVPGVDVVFLDTGYHFVETIGTRDAVAATLPVNLLTITPVQSVAEQDAEYGPDLHRRDPDLCCALRKVAPLREALAGYDAWATGLRRAETHNRVIAPVVGWDDKKQKVKVSPLARWTDDEVQQVIAKEAKKRREAAQAYDEAGRTELADSERAELAVLEEYLPTQLTDDDLAALVADAITETGADGMAGMGQVMKAVQPKVAGRAEGGRVAAAVKRALQG